MATVLDLATDALAELGVVADGEVLSASQASHALRVLNRFVSELAAQRLSIPAITRTTFTITANVGTYTVGTGGTVNVVRPVYVDHVSYVDTSATDPDPEYPLQPMTDDVYAGYTLKTLTGDFPTAWYYNPTYPLGTLELFPVPTSTTLTGVLYAPTAVAEFSTINDTVTLPPAYEQMLVKNLAVQLAPSYEREVGGLLLKQAQDALGTVKRANQRLSDLSFPADSLIGTGGGWFDIRTGQ